MTPARPTRGPTTRSLAAIRALFLADLGLLKRHARLRWTLAGVLLVPALYVLIYLAGVWDPNARLGSLRVGLVVSDAGARHAGREVRLGDEVRASLIEQASFDWQVLDDPDDARRRVRRGELRFAVMIPPDFSRLALAGDEAGAAKVVIYTSEGNDYLGASLAKRFAPELAHQVNEALNEQRWELVLQATDGSRQELGSLRAALQRLSEGSQELAGGLGQARQAARELNAGAVQLGTGSVRLGEGAGALAQGTQGLAPGMRQLRQGMTQMLETQPAESDLVALRAGTERLHQGQMELGRGLVTMQTGARRLRAGTATLQEMAADLPGVPETATTGLIDLLSGHDTLLDGLGAARDANRRLEAGALELRGGVRTLTEGLARLGGGLRRMDAALPEDDQLERLTAGAQDLRQGSQQLGAGLGRLAQGSDGLGRGLEQLEAGGERLHDGLSNVLALLPAGIDSPGGSARGLAESVRPVLEVAAPVPNEGSGFAPNLLPLALWLGATMCSFVFAFRRVPESVAGAPRPALVLGKLAWPALVVLAQAVVMQAVLTGVLGIDLPSAWRFALTLALTALAALALLFALVTMLGDVGKVVAVLLLVLQVSAAGAIVPIELATPLFQALHPWLPLTWVVRALRATMFGAYDGEWLRADAVVLLTVLAALALAMVAGRFRAVPDERYAPGIELD